MNLIIKHIKELVQTETSPRRWVAGSEMAKLPTIKNAFLVIENGLIADFGLMDAFAEIAEKYAGFEEIDATGRLVFPTFADSHTHIVYAGSREQEFVARIQGK